MWNPTRKFNEKAQTANFSDFTRQRQELCAKNAKKNQKIPKRETLGSFDWDLMGFIGGPLLNEKRRKRKIDDQRNDKHPQDFPKVSPKFPLDFPKMSPRFPHDFPNTSPSFPQDLPRISQGSPQDFPGSSQDLPMTSSGSPQDLP